MTRRYFKEKNLEEMSIDELLKYNREFKTLRLKALYRFKQEAEDEHVRIKKRLEKVQTSLKHMERQAKIDREAVDYHPNSSLFIH